jgi:hypothetical protein
VAGVKASEGAVTEGFFFAQQTPCGAVREKSRRHKPLQRRRAQPGDDQSGRRTRRRLGERHGTTHSGRGTQQHFKAVWGTNGEARRASPCHASQREQPGRARWREAMWCRLRKPGYGGMYGDASIAAAGVRRRMTKAACRAGRRFAHHVINGRRTDAISLRVMGP